MNKKVVIIGLALIFIGVTSYIIFTKRMEPIVASPLSKEVIGTKDQVVVPQTINVVNDKQNVSIYQSEYGTFKLQYPTTWVWQNSPSNTKVAQSVGFEPPNKHNNDIVIYISYQDKNNLQQNERTLEEIKKSFIEKYPDITIENIVLSGISGYKLTFTNNIGGITKKFESIYIINQENLYNLAYIAPLTEFVKYSYGFDEIIRSFTLLKQ